MTLDEALREIERREELLHGLDVDLAASRAEVARLQVDRDHFEKCFDAAMAGEFGCAYCGRDTANGICTECRQGTSPLKVAHAERDGARNEAAAYKRERDVLRLELDSETAHWTEAAVEAEREAIVCLIQNEGERRWGCWDPALVAAIRARGGP